MTTQQFSHLFTPLRIGSVTVPNRLLATAHWIKMAEVDPQGYHEWFQLGDRAKHYYAERAKGGWGLIIIGVTVVHPSCGTGRPSTFRDEAIPAYAKIAQAIHEHGAKAFVQICHLGRHRASAADDWEVAWGPSPSPVQDSVGHGQMCKEMEIEDIQAAVEGFAHTADNMRQAGFDGVEVHAAHDYLLDQFLTPLVNKRTDQYGGSLENRMRLLLEVLQAIRDRCGREFVVGVRLNGAWTAPGGRDISESQEIATRLDALGQVDFINVTGWPLTHAIAPAGTPHGQLVSYARAIKGAVKHAKVFSIGRIVDPLHAERILAEGSADMVAMTRASIADPELPNKAREGRLQDIRRCIGSGQGCFAGTGGPISCTQNPTAGRERDWGVGTMTPAAKTKHVLIAGAGPAGMEAAIVAAQRGHRVTLYDIAGRLGGQVPLFARSPRRGEFEHLISWRQRQIENLGVEVQLGVEVTLGLVARIAPDAVIVATGSAPSTTAPYADTPHLPAIPGADLPHVFTPSDVLEGKLDGSKYVAVIDAVGFYQGSDPVEYLAARGCKVHAVTHAPVFGPEMIVIDKPAFIKSLQGKDVTFHTSAIVRRITAQAVEATSTVSGADFTIAGLDAVVVAVQAQPRTALYKALKGHVRELYRIGDCLAPRGVSHAIFEGHQTGRTL